MEKNAGKEIPESCAMFRCYFDDPGLLATGRRSLDPFAGLDDLGYHLFNYSNPMLSTAPEPETAL